MSVLDTDFGSPKPFRPETGNSFFGQKILLAEISVHPYYKPCGMWWTTGIIRLYAINWIQDNGVNVTAAKNQACTRETFWE